MRAGTYNYASLTSAGTGTKEVFNKYLLDQGRKECLRHFGWMLFSPCFWFQTPPPTQMWVIRSVTMTSVFIDWFCPPRTLSHFLLTLECEPRSFLKGIPLSGHNLVPWDKVSELYTISLPNMQRHQLRVKVGSLLWKQYLVRVLKKDWPWKQD